MLAKKYQNQGIRERKKTWGPGKPPTGQPRGHLTSFWSRVYSCSIPYLMKLKVNHIVQEKKLQNLWEKKTKRLNNIPRLFCNYIRMTEDLGCCMSLVGRNWLSSRSISITHNLKQNQTHQDLVNTNETKHKIQNKTHKNIVASSEWILENCLRAVT